MVAVGMLLVWGGYSVSLWGWSLLRGYNVTFGQLVSPTHPYGSGKGQKWPPPQLPDTQIFPGKQAPATAAKAAVSSGGGNPAGTTLA